MREGVLAAAGGAHSPAASPENAEWPQDETRDRDFRDDLGAPVQEVGFRPWIYRLAWEEGG